MPEFESAARSLPSRAVMDPRWAPLRRRLDPELGPPGDAEYGEELARCVEHVFPNEVSPARRPEADWPRAPKVTPEEWTQGPLVLARTMVDGRCRGCQMRGQPTGPAIAEVRAAEAKTAPLALFASEEGEATAAPSDDDEAEFYRVTPRGER